MAGRGAIEDRELVSGLSVWYLKYSAFWGVFNHWRDQGTRSGTFILQAVATMGVFGPLCISSVLGPFFIEKDLEGITINLLNPMSTMQMAIKFTTLWVHIERQAAILEVLKSDFISCVPPEKQKQADEIIRKSGKQATKLANIIIGVNIFTVSVWNFLPILRSGYIRETLGITLFGKPAPGQNKILGFWYPVDYDQTPWTQILYVYEFLSCFWAGFIITILEALIVQIVVLLTGHLKVFHFLLADLKERQHVNLMKKSERDRLDNEELVRYVKEHQSVMKVGDSLSELYNFPITLQLVTGLFILVIGIFNFFLGSGKGDLVLMFKFIIYTTYTLVEVGLYCYTGNELESVSEDLGFGVYESEWYRKGVEFRKTAMKVMLRTKHPVTLKAGKIYVINRETFTNILQMAYSTSMFMFRFASKDVAQN